MSFSGVTSYFSSWVLSPKVTEAQQASKSTLSQPDPSFIKHVPSVDDLSRVGRSGTQETIDTSMSGFDSDNSLDRDFAGSMSVVSEPKVGDSLHEIKDDLLAAKNDVSINGSRVTSLLEFFNTRKDAIVYLLNDLNDKNSFHSTTKYFRSNNTVQTNRVIKAILETSPEKGVEFALKSGDGVLEPIEKNLEKDVGVGVKRILSPEDSKKILIIMPYQYTNASKDLLGLFGLSESYSLGYKLLGMEPVKV